MPVCLQRERERERAQILFLSDIFVIRVALAECVYADLQSRESLVEPVLSPTSILIV